MRLRILQSRTQAVWLSHISRLLPRQTLPVYRRGDAVSLWGTDEELVGVYDVTTEIDPLWADVLAHVESVKEAA
jgi:nitrous oxidase accessory protein NosD